VEKNGTTLEAASFCTEHVYTRFDSRRLSASKLRVEAVDTWTMSSFVGIGRDRLPSLLRYMATVVQKLGSIQQMKK
jgi:hypothetical protein